MSAQRSRILIVTANLAIIVVIALLGVRSFMGSSPDPAEVPPENFNPLQYDIPIRIGGQSSEREHAVTWLQFDRPEKVVIAPRVGRKLPRLGPRI